MLMRTRALSWILIAILLSSTGARAELNWGDLNSTRTVTEADWLRVNLSLMGLKLSYPAYRISLDLTDDGVIEFVFVASSGMAGHLTEEIGKSEAEEVIAYHARGISEQIEELIRDEFPSLWSDFDARVDVRGRFLGPGADWDDPPREIGNWLEKKFSWEP